MIRFADDIRLWRLTHRLTVQEAADLANVSARQWSRWEWERAKPREENYNAVRWLIAHDPHG